MDDDPRRSVASIRKNYLPWLHKRQGKVRHVLATFNGDTYEALCGLIVKDDGRQLFTWRGSKTDQPAQRMPVCGNCANVARAIVAEAEQ